jgi:hypothetical protein
LSEKQIRIDPDFLEATIWFLADIVRRMGYPIGQGAIQRWLQTKATGDWTDDKDVYTRLKLIVEVQESRAQGLRSITEADYAADRQ